MSKMTIFGERQLEELDAFDLHAARDTVIDAMTVFSRALCLGFMKMRPVEQVEVFARYAHDLAEVQAELRRRRYILPR